VRILLESGKIVSSSSERLLLKSLGSWIGALTLARNKPLLRKELDIKELLLDAYSNGRLIAVVPFVSKLLVMSKGSLVFKPTNPWLAAILRLLKEIYSVPDLKLNVKFELPLLTKELGIDANEIEPSQQLRFRPAPVRDGNPDFTAIKKLAGVTSPVRSGSPDASPVRAGAREAVRAEAFVAGGASGDGSAPGASGVPIFSLGGVPPGGAGGPGGGLTALSDMASVIGAVGGGGGVRANAPGSEAVADLATIMATASLASSGVQQHTGPLQRLGGGRGGGGSAAAVAAAAAAAQQAAAAAAAAVANEANLIPNLVQHIVISPSLVMFQTAPHLKTYIPAAIDRAVREIINPVVERSCAIATITTRELALKDFAHEMDAAKVQRAAKQMVQQLAGSLALVTCKEPLRVSMGNQLRPQLSPAAAGDTNLLEQTVQVLCTSNLEIGCAIIELAATERAARDINEVIAPLFSARRQQHPQQQRHGFGLLAPSSAQDVLRVYDDFAALPRTAAASAVPVNPAAGGPPGGSFTGYLPSPAVQPGGSAGGARPGSAGVGGESSAIMSARGHGIAPAAAHAPMPSRSAARQMTYSTAPGGSSGVAGAPGGAADPFGAAAAIGAPAGAAGAASVMASPSAMAEAMRIATAQAPSMSAAHVLSSSSVPMAPGEDKLSTQQVLELFNTVYPHLTAAILSAVEAASPSSGSSSSAAQGTDALSLADLSADHEVQRCRLQIAQAVKRSLTADEASMAVAQKVFKRLYEGDSNLHRDVHVSLLESMRECSRRLSKELVSWLAYSDDSKKLNRECAVALLRPGSLLHITSYDELVAKACDNGRNSAAMEFAAFLVQRVIIEEPLTTTRELYLTLEVLTKVGRRSPPGAPPSAPQGLIALVEACRNVVHRPAPSPSAGSAASSSGGNAGGQGGASGSAEGHLAAAAKAARAAGEAEAMDPPGSRETVASVLTEWQRVLSSGTATRPVSDRVVASFVTQAKPTTLYNDEARDRFLRIGIDLVCVATSGGLNSRSKGAAGAASPIATAPYTPVEAMVRLVAALCKTETSGESAAKGVAMLVAYLQALVRSIVKATHGGDVRPHFRLFLGIVTELSVGMPAVDSGETSASATLEQDGTSASASTPSSTGENGIWNGLEPALPSRSADGFGGGGAEQAAGTANFQVLSTIASALNACNPHLAPSFAFAWLQIVSNRDVMPRLLSYRSGKGWQLLRQLVVSMLSFLSPHLARVGPQGEIPAPIRSLYRGILRVLLVLLHDFPEFLCDYHFALCDVIPPSCIQMRNLVLSAYPRSMRLPDPFMPNLKVDKLAEMAAEPRVLSNLTTSLVGAGVKAIVDKFLHDPAAQPAASLGLHAKLLAKDRPPSYNVPAINAVVLYLGQQSIARTAPGAQPVINGPSTEVLQSLIADLGGEGRYHLLNAIANQLRYPNSHTHYFSCVLLFLFRDSSDDSVKEQITRVLVERLIANRPHPWGLLITFIELIKNTEYGFWTHDFVRCAPQIERLFENVVRFALSSPSGSGSGSTPAGPPAKPGAQAAGL
jgi:CCR4-NOT transcription complex subunit 1